MPTLRHNQFHDGSVQSIGLLPDGEEKTTMTVGLALPGHWDFGVNTRREMITVTSGEIIINGQKCRYGLDSIIIIKAGDRVVFDVEKPSSYICSFPPE
jgi:uncharacterized protein YaiE (UPF0345 family)